MRSLAFTTLLTIVTAAVCGLAVIQWSQGGFDQLFGMPATPVGDRLYTSFTPEDVHRIEVRSNNVKGTFSIEDNVWTANSPWQDRMDPVAAATIIHFTLGMRVEDVTHESKVKISRTGLGDNAIVVRLRNKKGNTIAHYRLGRNSSWMAEIEGAEAPVSTLFVQPHDNNRDNHVYICTGDITPLFADGLKLLRDHKPLYFNPLNIRKISIHSQQGDLILGKKDPQAAWRIVKPLDLPTDVNMMKRLIEGLFKLRATKVGDRNDVTLPATGSAINNTSITLTRFGSDKKTTLEIFPPESAEALQSYAIVSDRPNTVFELPVKPATGMASLADLPLGVNALRDPTLTHLNIGSLSAIDIIPATGSPIHLLRQPGQPWMAETTGSSFYANEENLFRLLKAVTTTRAIGFESDAATDFSPWGLDQPVLTLRFHGNTGEALELRFGLNLAGGLFVNRSGTSTVMRVDRSLLTRFAIRPHEWKHSRLWSINKVNLTNIVLKQPNRHELVLKYDFFEESWKAASNGIDMTSNLLPSRADFMLSQLEGIKVTRWLAGGDSDALSALSQPSLTVTTMEEEKDEDDNITGIKISKLTLAPVTSGPSIGNFYGISSADKNPFILDRATYDKLTTPLFEN